MKIFHGNSIKPVMKSFISILNLRQLVFCHHRKSFIQDISMEMLKILTQATENLMNTFKTK